MYKFIQKHKNTTSDESPKTLYLLVRKKFENLLRVISPISLAFVWTLCPFLNPLPFIIVSSHRCQPPLKEIKQHSSSAKTILLISLYIHCLFWNLYYFWFIFLCWTKFFTHFKIINNILFFINIFQINLMENLNNYFL